VISCSTIQTVPPINWQALDRAIENIDRYGWIVFTSSNGVRYFTDRLAELNREPSIIEGLICVAIGPGTAAKLAEKGIDVDTVASDSRAEGALESIIRRAGGKEAIRGQRFLLCRAAVARELLPASLRELGANVDDVETYRTVRPDVNMKQIVERFEAGAVDAIAFTSSSTVSNLAEMVAPIPLESLLEGVLVGCIGPATAATAESLGITNTVQPEVHTVAALIDAITARLTVI